MQYRKPTEEKHNKYISETIPVLMIQVKANIQKIKKKAQIFNQTGHRTQF